MNDSSQIVFSGIDPRAQESGFKLYRTTVYVAPWSTYNQGLARNYSSNDYSPWVHVIYHDAPLIFLSQIKKGICWFYMPQDIVDFGIPPVISLVPSIDPRYNTLTARNVC